MYSKEKFDPMTVIGKASTKMPLNMVMVPTSWPNNVIGYMSPYPTVVLVTTTHQKDAGMDTKGLMDLLPKESTRT